MSYESKLSRAKEVVGNEDVWDAFLGKLHEIGGTNDEALRECSWEDLESCGLPKLVAKRVAAIFRKEEAEERPRVVSPKKAAGMSVRELLENFDPRDPSNPVGVRLTALSNGKRCIVFKDDGSVNVEASEALVKELRDSFPERETYVVDSRPLPTFKVGERPDQLAEENPLYPGRVLRPDGTCDQTNRSWGGVPLVVRQLLYLAVQLHEIVIGSIDDAHGRLDLALSENAEATVRSRYAKASVRFDQLQGEGKLPSLKVHLAGAVSGGRTNNPFGHRTY